MRRINKKEWNLWNKSRLTNFSVDWISRKYWENNTLQNMFLNTREVRRCWKWIKMRSHHSLTSRNKKLQSLSTYRDLTTTVVNSNKQLSLLRIKLRRQRRSQQKMVRKTISPNLSLMSMRKNPNRCGKPVEIFDIYERLI